MNHYTYMVQTPPVDGRRVYIGVRSCKGAPESDVYMGSSKTLRAWIAENKDSATKIVLAQWPTREEAMAHEVFLHDCFDVGVNRECWNQARATTALFDVTGLVRPQAFRDGVAKRMRERVVSAATKQKISLSKKGSVPPNKGIPLSAETKAKLSAALKGKPGPNLGRVASAESRAKNAAAKLKNPTRYWLGKTRSEADRQKFRVARLGKAISESTKALLSKKLTGYVYQIVECPHCGTLGGETGMKRWHFEKCRHKAAAQQI